MMALISGRSLGGSGSTTSSSSSRDPGGGGSGGSGGGGVRAAGRTSTSSMNSSSRGSTSQNGRKAELPDFETLLASGTSLRLSTSNDRRDSMDQDEHGMDDIAEEDETEEDLAQHGEPLQAKGGQQYRQLHAGSGEKSRGRAGALRDLEREMKRHEVQEQEEEQEDRNGTLSEEEERDRHAGAGTAAAGSSERTPPVSVGTPAVTAKQVRSSRTMERTDSRTSNSSDKALPGLPPSLDAKRAIAIAGGSTSGAGMKSAGSGTDGDGARMISKNTYDLSGGLIGTDRETQVARSRQSSAPSSTSNGLLPYPGPGEYTLRDTRTTSTDENDDDDARDEVLATPPMVATPSGTTESPRQRNSSFSSQSYVHVPSTTNDQNKPPASRTTSSSSTSTPPQLTRAEHANRYRQSTTPAASGLGIEHQYQSSSSTLPNHVTASSIAPTTSNSTTSSGAGGTKRMTRKSSRGDDGTVSNALRKTSGFFRKTFGISSQQDVYQNQTRSASNSGLDRTYSGSSMSAPTTPTSSRFSGSTAYQDKPSSSSRPPVPSIPSNYNRAAARDDRRISPRREALDREANPVALHGAPANKGSPAKIHDRLGGMSSSTTPTQTSPTIANGSMKKSTSSSLSEHERLQRELDYWRQTEDGLTDTMNGDYSTDTVRASDKSKNRNSGSGAFTNFALANPTGSPASRRLEQRGRADSSSAFVSGSLPSPNASPVIVSGSTASPELLQRTTRTLRAGNDIRLDSTASSGTSGTHSTLTDGTATPMLEEASSPALLASGSKDGVLQPLSGKQVRKRATSSSSPASVQGQTLASPLLMDTRPSNGRDGQDSRPTIRLVGSPESSHAQERIAPWSFTSVSAHSTPANVFPSYGLGLGLEHTLTEKADIQHFESPTALRTSLAHVSMFPTSLPPGTSPQHSKSSSPVPSRVATLRTPKLGVGSEDAFNPIRSLSPDSAHSLDASMSLQDRARTLADKCWQEDETFLKKDKIAEWLGGQADLNQAALYEYIGHFEFTDLRIDIAFRRLCEKLYLKAETQQIDRILSAFSGKYLADNPQTILAHHDIIHATTYAMLLLNTDLHVADVTSRMSRSDFVYNTMSAIRAQTESPPLGVPLNEGGSATPRSSQTPVMEQVEIFIDEDLRESPVTLDNNASIERRGDATSTAPRLRTKRSGSASASSSRTGLNDIAAYGSSTSNLAGVAPAQSPVRERPVTIFGGDLFASTRSASASNANSRARDLELEALLREIYAAVRARPIMQPLEYSSLAPPGAASGPNSPYSTLSAMSRTPSRRSQVSLANDRTVSNKRTSIRGLLGASHENLRASSPTPSGQTTISGSLFGGNSFGSTTSAATSYYPATMGFASNLSHSIIREQQEDDAASVSSDASATDEELALLGAPWAKEGLLQRKHYWESAIKRSKDKNWTEVFAVIEKGDMRMFQFGGPGVGGGYSGTIGGGNWLSNAQTVGDITLAHCLCSAMPPPGYNRQRPHVLVLTLPNGGSYFFQAGTEDLVNEWVLTCNYWAGRTSKEPLMGGVSNMDHGWNRVLAANQESEDLRSIRSGKSAHSHRSRMSYAGSIGRHSMASGTGQHGDRVVLYDWTPPQPPSTKSTLSEDSQLESLKRHSAALQTELEQHNELRQPMLRLYAARSVSANKALANWEKKSKYLLAELVKYQTYADALKVARVERQKKRDENKLNRLLKHADDDTRSLNDPVYSPAPNSTATFAQQQGSMNGNTSGIEENDASYAQHLSPSEDVGAGLTTSRRASNATETTTTTANEPFDTPPEERETLH